jgi:hypothetical protein
MRKGRMMMRKGRMMMRKGRMMMSNISPTFAKKNAPRHGVDIMEHAGFKASLMMAERLKGEHVHGLPPGSPVHVYPIASLPGAPEEWSREAGTYVCPVAPDWGLWFDWTMNDEANTAIVPSVKGMNPITGQHITMINMEQYADKCPIHGCDLSHERFCEECGYKLPPQNYVCSPNTLWWDGFRQPDGTVRQFFFTEDEEKDVAEAVIGKENTVPAFGFAFFKPKKAREPHVQVCGAYGVYGVYGASGNSGPVFRDCSSMSHVTKKKMFLGTSTDSNTYYYYYDSSDNIITCRASGETLTSGGIASRSAGAAEEVTAYSCGDINIMSEEAISKRPSMYNTKALRSVAVGAGAQIRQDLQKDTLDVDDWKEQETAVIRLYFVFENKFRNIIESGGMKDVTGNDSGYLTDIPVG